MTTKGSDWLVGGASAPGAAEADAVPSGQLVLAQPLGDRLDLRVRAPDLVLVDEGADGDVDQLPDGVGERSVEVALPLQLFLADVFLHVARHAGILEHVPVAITVAGSAGIAR